MAEDKESGIPCEFEINSIDFLDIGAGKYTQLNGYESILIECSDEIDATTVGSIYSSIRLGEKTVENLVLESGEFFQIVEDSSISISEEGVYTVAN